MDYDNLSIASDFSVIPDSMVHMDETEQIPAPMCASFFQSFHSEALATNNQSDKVTFGPVNKVGVEPNTSLSVIFWFSDQFTPKSSDRIALYKVGFSSTKDFICYKWVPNISSSHEPRSSHHSYTVDFGADLLPKDSDDYFQMCYLMQNGHIVGVSTTFSLKQNELPESTDALEEAARNVLSIRIRELLQENTEIKEDLQSYKGSLAEVQDLNRDLDNENKGHIVEKENCKKLVHNLKETLTENQTQLEKLKIEIMAKEEEIRQEHLLVHELQEKLLTTVLSMNELKEKLSESEEGKSITEERQLVLVQDNQELMTTLKLIKEELETSMKEKVAAEKIASDLSQELQTTRANYQEINVVNLKLTRKVKKLRRVIALMEAGSNDDFICVEEDIEARKEEDKTVDDEMVSASMSASVASVASACASSSCSQKLSETVFSVKKTMDEIVHQLNEQTEEMKSLKNEITRKNQQEVGAISLRKSRENSDAEKSRSSVSSEDEKKVLYEHSFLPAHCTAPVFLPARAETPKKNTPTPKPIPRSNAPSAPSPTPSMMIEEGIILPMPIQPVATKAATNAAVLRRFSEGSSHHADENSPQPPPPSQQQRQAVEGVASRQAHQQESDDEDYHSAGDAGEQNAAQCQSTSLRCPMCPLEFLPTAMHLLNEHINHHLDRTCPVCSLAFQRSTPQKKYEDHVQSHFMDEGVVSSDDPSGPWDPRDTGRSFQLLEID